MRKFQSNSVQPGLRPQAFGLNAQSVQLGAHASLQGVVYQTMLLDTVKPSKAGHNQGHSDRHRRASLHAHFRSASLI